MNHKFGQYNILSVLGEGAMGKVYYAHHSQGQEVALKLFKQGVLRSTKDLQTVKKRFKQEAQIAYKLKHPHIIQTFDTGEIDGHLYIAFEVIRGGSLYEHLKKVKKFSPGQTLQIIYQLLLGLNEIHCQGLIHRDIKPANVLVADAEQMLLKLSDLGLARPVCAEDRTYITKTGAPMGTPFYMSPEQINGESELDIRCDLYALGVLFYECLTGHPPFQGRSIVQLFHKHLQEPIPDIRKEIPAIQPEISQLITCLLAKNPQQRPHSPSDVILRLRPFLNIKEIDWETTREVITNTDTNNKTITNVQTLLPNIPKVDVNPVVANTNEYCLVASGKMQDRNRLLRARLVVDGSPNSLFVYSGCRLLVGRNALDEDRQDICLRPRPQTQEANYISGKHFSVFVQNQKAYVIDLGSARTALDKQKLLAFDSKELISIHHVNVAEVLQLKIHRICADKIPIVVANTEGIDNRSPSIFMERLLNGTEHSYALIPGRLCLKLDSLKALKPCQDGDFEIFSIANFLWIWTGKPSANACFPLLLNQTYKVIGGTIKVLPIALEDFK